MDIPGKGTSWLWNTRGGVISNGLATRWGEAGYCPGQGLGLKELSPAGVWGGGVKEEPELYKTPLDE